MEIRANRKTSTFLALPVDEKYHSVMMQMQSELMEGLEYLPHSINWTKKNRLHLTLFFLGEQLPQALENLISEISKMVQDLPPETIQFHATQMELFPSPKPTVIALTGECPAPLKHIRKSLGLCLKNTETYPDLSHETKGFLPHVTLGKLTEATDLKTEFCDISVDFSQLILFKSEQTSPWAVTHTPLYTWELLTAL